MFYGVNGERKKMKKLNLILGMAIIGSQLAITGIASADEMVNGYVKSSGATVLNSAGECWRTGYTDTTEKLEACGYVMPEPETARVEIVATPTAATISTKVMEKVTIAANMLFAFDSAELSSDAKAVIDERIDRVRGRVKLTSIMEVRGHTCSMGPEAYNQKLSERRAQAVADYIVSASPRVTASDIKVVGMGESDPVATNDTREGRMKNRRVEIFAQGEVDAK